MEYLTHQALTIGCILQMMENLNNDTLQAVQMFFQQYDRSIICLFENKKKDFILFYLG